MKYKVFRILGKISLLLIVITATGLVVLGQSVAKKKVVCKPSISKGDSLIKALNVDKTFSFSSVLAKCFPIPKKRGARYWYDPYQGGKFSTVLRNAKGEELNTYAWYGNRRYASNINENSADFLMSRYEILGGPEKLKKLTAGNYKVEFLLGNRIVDTFEFKVLVKDVADPYRPGKVYLSDGTWRESALLEFLRKSTCLRYFVRVPYSVASSREQIVPFKLEIKRDRDKKIIGKNEGGLRLDTSWVRSRQCINKSGSYEGLTLGDIVQQNGGYTIELTLNGKVFSRFGFEVKDGKVNGRIPTSRKRFVSIKSK